MKVLELFSGTGSVSKVCEELGYEVVSVDISNKFHQPTHLIDILNFDYKQYKVGEFDIIWSSPPCRTFSSMRFLTKTNKEILLDIVNEGLPPLLKTLEIIDYLKPKYYFIENPMNSKMKEYLKKRSCRIISYCQYGYDYQKNTRIWTNKEFVPKRCTKATCKYYGNHPNKIGTTRTGDSKKMQQLKKKYSIPADLIKDLFNQ